MKAIKDSTVLIVDDEEALREAIAFDYKRKGFRVLCASNGHEAFEIVKKEPVDVVLSDIRMPDGDGVELLKRIRERDPSIPVVVFITGYTDLTTEEAYDLGASAIFAKPFDRKELFASVERALLSKQEAWSRRPGQGDPVFRIEMKFKGLATAVQERALNIGQGGMFVSGVERRPEVNTRVSFDIRFEEAPLTRISGEGIVRWVRGRESAGGLVGGLGIEFLYLDEENRAQVVQMIANGGIKAFIPRS